MTIYREYNDYYSCFLMNPEVVPGRMTTYREYNDYYSNFLMNPEVVPGRMTIYREYNDYYSSFLVNPEVVPGRMTMLVTLFLVLINIHNTIQTNSPKVIVNLCFRLWKTKHYGHTKNEIQNSYFKHFGLYSNTSFYNLFSFLVFFMFVLFSFFTNYRVSESHPLNLCLINNHETSLFFQSKIDYFYLCILC